MAIVATHILTAASGSGLNSYATASGSPTTGRLQLLFVGHQQSATTVVTPTVTGAGLTWVQIATSVASDNLRRGTLFRALGTASAGVLTIDMGGVTQIRAGWSWSEFTGADTSGADGAGAIVQSATARRDFADGAQTSITVTLAAFGSANNATYGAMRFGDFGTVTVGSGFSELGTALAGSVTYTSEFKNTNDTTVDWTFPSVASFTQAIAVEIKEATTTGVNTSRKNYISNMVSI